MISLDAKNKEHLLQWLLKWQKKVGFKRKDFQTS
jgi:hypothetical protein